ncbi:MAG: hypothetical protein AB1489_42550 [Acidobacteriota bacterium]
MRVRRSIIFIWIVSTLVCVVNAFATPQALPPNATPKAQPPTKVLSLAKEIPKNASLDELNRRLGPIIIEINRTTRPEMGLVYQAIETLATQPNIVEALMSRYLALPSTNYHQRLLTIRLMGELRRQDALKYLQQVASRPLPAKTKFHGMTPRDYEEMIQTKAVQGIAYLRTDTSLNYTISIMLNHESTVVRIAAIDAYMWNHNDNKETASKLYQLLPTNMHRYVERPRFHRNMNVDDFNAKLRAWQQKWGNK